MKICAALKSHSKKNLPLGIFEKSFMKNLCRKIIVDMKVSSIFFGFLLVTITNEITSTESHWQIRISAPYALRVEWMETVFQSALNIIQTEGKQKFLNSIGARHFEECQGWAFDKKILKIRKTVHRLMIGTNLFGF